MNTKINKNSFSSLLFFITEPMFLHVGITEILNSSKNGSIYSIVFGTIISLLIIYLIIKVFNYEKDLNIFQKIEKKFKTGKLINLFLTIVTSLYFIYQLWCINTYIQNKYLDSTPSFIIIGLFLFPVIWTSASSMKSISKISISVFFVSMFVIIFSFSNLASSIELDNFKPFFNTKIITIIKDSIKYALYFSTPVFMILVIPKNTIEDSKKINKNLLVYFLLSSFYLLLLFSFIIGIFGIDLAKMFSYPEYSLMKKINYFDFIQHVENITTISWFYTLFISSSLSLFFIKEYLKHLKIYNLKRLLIIALICFISSLCLFKNTTIGFNIIKDYYIFIYSIPICLLLFSFIIKRNN